MGNVSIFDVTEYVEQHIGVFHKKRIAKIETLKLKDVLKRKNPYLFKAKYMQTAETIIRELIDATISSSEETIFGNWLEGLALFINQKVYAGWKPVIKGLDLEFDKDGVRYIVSIKSGPHWANSSQRSQMLTDFDNAKKELLNRNPQAQIVCVNGCCYGKDHTPDKGLYVKYCGQRFWEFIGGNETMYTDIIEPLGHTAKERNEEYAVQYTRLVNRFTKEFVNLFCDDTGTIDWNRLVHYNSGKDQ